MIQKLFSGIWWVRLNYINFEGRLARKPFWQTMIAMMSMTLMPWVVMFVSFPILDNIEINASSQWVLIILGTLILTSVVSGLILLIPFFGICVRRLHDVGMSGKHTLWMLVGNIFAFGVLCVFFAEKGDPFSNRFGPSPKGVTDQGIVEEF